MRAAAVVALALLAGVGLYRLLLHESVPTGPLVKPLEDPQAESDSPRRLATPAPTGSGPPGGPDRKIREPASPERGEVEPGFDRRAVYGRVVDTSREPIASARVLLFDGAVPRDRWRVPERETHTNAHGRFHLGDLEALHEPPVQVSADGFVPHLEELLTGRDHEIVLTRATLLEGRVTRAGAPFPGVVASAGFGRWDGERFASTGTATSNADGSFALDLRAGGTVLLTLTPPRGIPVSREVRLEDGPRTRFDADLHVAGELLGRTTDAASGRGVAGAGVTVHGRALARSDTEGSFALPVFPDTGLVSIGAELDGYCRSESLVNVDRLLESGSVLELPLLRGGSVSGLVLDENGSPVPGVRVYTSNKNTAEAALPTGMVRRRDGSGADDVATDETGAFRLVTLVCGPEEIRVFARAASGARTSGTVVLPAPGSKAELQLVIEELGAIRGRVLVEGRPSPGHVTFRGAGMSRGATCNDGGEFVLERLPPGEGRISARVAGVRYPDESVRIARGQTLEHDIDVPASRLSVSGRITDEEGRPYADLVVHVRSVMGPSGSGRTDEDGRYEIHVTTPGETSFRVIARDGPAWATLDHVTLPRSGADLVLPRPRDVALLVTDLWTGEPVEPFELFWKRDGRWTEYDLGEGLRLPIGTHDLLVRAPGAGYRPEELGIVVGDRPDPLDLRLRPGTTLRIVAEGDPLELEGRELVLVPTHVFEERAEGSEEPEAADFADDPSIPVLRFHEGVAELGGVVPGTYVPLMDQEYGESIAVTPTGIQVREVEREEVRLNVEVLSANALGIGG